MNYHYIDYMIRERQREELKVCERRRLLKSAGYSETGLFHWINNVVSKAVQRMKKLRLNPPKRLPICFSMTHRVVQTKGGRQ